ncbi:MAG: type II toxin-antitoxin system HicB family antitoxin [Chloroflexi bacterium]|nr:type II toxin-antitoxin system HicB family antitoxin [Chloroflexota bacterium]MDA1271293.1 type II toxin-antitoxin system HicB family antitoxin [Chloroflexota bacterium]PKB58182.1 MAG: hypothetical protein BZY83_08325 [SAR202 cluster bacterium Casp-Chloro-G2]
MRYAVVYERTKENFSAYVPDLPGCIATGETPDEVKRNIREAIVFHIEGIRLENLSIPEPSAWSDTVEVPA